MTTTRNPESVSAPFSTTHLPAKRIILPSFLAVLMACSFLHGNSQTNTKTGIDALSRNTTGTDNTANGYFALKFNTAGSANTANGANALFANTTGNSNTGTGFASLYSNATAHYNSAHGYASLYVDGQLINTRQMLLTK